MKQEFRASVTGFVMGLVLAVILAIPVSGWLNAGYVRDAQEQGMRLGSMTVDAKVLKDQWDSGYRSGEAHASMVWDHERRALDLAPSGRPDSGDWYTAIVLMRKAAKGAGVIAVADGPSPRMFVEQAPPVAAGRGKPTD